MEAEPGLSPTGPAADAVAAAPLIDGPVEMLWLLAFSILFIMALVFVLLLRTRAARRARLGATETEFFKPAGEGAEITFDDAAAADDRNTPALPKKNRGAFSGLFAQRDRKPAIDAGAATEVGADDDGGGLASVNIERDGDLAEREAADAINARLAEELEAERRAAETERRLREAEIRQRDADARERERLMIEEQDRRRATDALQARRLEEEARRAEDLSSARLAAAPQSPIGAEDYSRTLAEIEEAMAVQREAIQAETRALLDAFAQRLWSRLDAVATAVERGPAPAPAPAAFAAIARDMEALRERFDRAGAVDPAAIQQELALLRQAITGPRDAAAPAVQLADVIRNALPPDAYDMPAALANGRRADCLVKFPRPSGPIAVDARFPVEAFSLLRGAGGEAENEFRRMAIRHVVDVAERMIAPGETADSAILFLPSEAMYTELHHRFPDVVQDAWRAHVWIVSPTTLMATLHTIKAALAAAGPRGGAFLRAEEPGLAGEMTDLKRRIAALEDALARAGAQATTESAARPETAAPPRGVFPSTLLARGALGPAPGLGGDAGLLEEDAESAEAPPVRPLFPLR